MVTRLVAGAVAAAAFMGAVVYLANTPVVRGSIPFDFAPDPS